MLTLLPGDIICVRGTSLVDWGIEEVTHSKYSHTALVVDKHWLVEAQYPHKVRKVPPSDYKGYADVYRYKDIPQSKRLEIISKALKYEGRHYSVWLIFLEFLRYELGIQLIYRGQDVICSLLVADAIRAANLPFCQGLMYPSPGDCSLDKEHVEYVGSY